jgi:hypothetical protein
MKELISWLKKVFEKDYNKINKNSARNIYIRTSRDNSAGNNFGY